MMLQIQRLYAKIEKTKEHILLLQRDCPHTERLEKVTGIEDELGNSFIGFAHRYTCLRCDHTWWEDVYKK